MKNIFTLIIFILFSQLIISQTDFKDNNERIYEIDYKGSQKIVLEKNSSNVFKGKVINTVNKYGLFNRTISKRVKIKSEIAKRLMTELYLIGFDSLNVIDCTFLPELLNKTFEEREAYINKYGDNRHCLDGTTTYYKIQVKDSVRDFYFDCLHKDEMIDSTTLPRRELALKGLKIIDKEINLEHLNSDFWKSLGRGTYGGDGPYYIIKK